MGTTETDNKPSTNKPAPRGPSRFSGGGGGVLSRATSVFLGTIALDVRSLAVARILFSVIVILDVYGRLGDYDYFYTDRGVLPRWAVLEIVNVREDFSLFQAFLASCAYWWPAVCFFLELVAAAMFLVGYRTRLANVLLWFMVKSCQNRNILVLNGGDTILAVSLFWFAFLPMGDVLSMDVTARQRKKTAESAELPRKLVISGGSFALHVQLFCIYYFAARSKTGDTWKNGKAVYYVMQLDHFAKEPFATFIRSREYLWRPLTYATPMWQLAGSWLIFSPFYREVIRSVVIVMFVFMHVGFFLGMELGLFPWVCSALWIALVPGCVWDGLGWSLHPCTAENEDSPGLHRNSTLARMRRSLPHITAAFLTSVILLWNVTNVRENSFMLPPLYETIAYGLQLHQDFRFFSPDPAKDDGWYLLPAVLKSGREVELWRDGLMNEAPVLWASNEERGKWNTKSQSSSSAARQEAYKLSRIKPEHISRSIKNMRWRAYMRFLSTPKWESMRLPFGRGICRHWNSRHHGQEQLREFMFVHMLEVNRGPGIPEDEVQPILLWKHYCFSEDAPEANKRRK